VAVSGIRLSAVDVGPQPTSFEYVAVRVMSSTSSAIIAVLYRPGYADVTANFFAEFTDFLDRLLTFADPVLLTGDVNIHVERVSTSVYPTVVCCAGRRSSTVRRHCTPLPSADAERCLT